MVAVSSGDFSITAADFAHNQFPIMSGADSSQINYIIPSSSKGVIENSLIDRLNVKEVIGNSYFITSGGEINYTILVGYENIKTVKIDDGRIVDSCQKHAMNFVHDGFILCRKIKEWFENTWKAFVGIFKAIFTCRVDASSQNNLIEIKSNGDIVQQSKTKDGVVVGIANEDNTVYDGFEVNIGCGPRRESNHQIWERGVRNAFNNFFGEFFGANKKQKQIDRIQKQPINPDRVQTIVLKNCTVGEVVFDSNNGVVVLEGASKVENVIGGKILTKSL